MNVEFWIAIVGAITTAIGGLWGWISNRKAAKAENKLKEIEAKKEDLGFYMTLVEDNKKQLVELRAENDELRKQIEGIREQNEGLKLQNEELKVQNTKISAQNEELLKEINNMKKTIEKLTKEVKDSKETRTNVVVVAPEKTAKKVAVKKEKK